MDGYNFLDLAVRLSASRNEADLRSAVSRAYYGAYHLAMSLVEDAGIIMPASAEAHDKLVWLLDAGQIPESCFASRMLGSLRKERNRSDYNLKDPKPSHAGNVRTQLLAAQDIAAALAACGVEPNRSSVISNMRAFAQNTLRLSVSDVSRFPKVPLWRESGPLTCYNLATSNSGHPGFARSTGFASRSVS